MEIEWMLLAATVACSVAVHVASSRRSRAIEKRVKRLEGRLSGIRDAVDGW